MIEVSHLTYLYPHAETPCLKDISFSVSEGESIGVIGPNKAGKSTLCYALMGFVPHFYHGTISGDVFIDGVNVPDTNLAKMPGYVGIVFQNPQNQLSGAKLTVEDEIAFGLENLGFPRSVMSERIDWVLDLLGISRLRHRNPFHLSGGQMQRVAIASVLALKPKVLVLDEPTSQLDPQGTAEVFSAVRTLRQEGITIVVVEHKTETLAEHCSKFVVLVNGELKMFDTPERVFSHPQIDEWGIEIPLFSKAYRKIDIAAETIPSTLMDTARRLKQFEERHRD